MNSRFVSGLSAELYTASYFARQGYEIFWPLVTQSKSDYLIFKDGQALKIQSKKATWSKTGNYSYLQTRLTNSNFKDRPRYLKGDFDLLAITDYKNIWVIPFNEIEGLTSLCLGSTKQDYKPQTQDDAKKWIVE